MIGGQRFKSISSRIPQNVLQSAQDRAFGGRVFSSCRVWGRRCSVTFPKRAPLNLFVCQVLPLPVSLLTLFGVSGAFPVERGLILRMKICPARTKNFWETRRCSKSSTATLSKTEYFQTREGDLVEFACPKPFHKQHVLANQRPTKQ